MILGFSLREKHREGSESDFPLPLAVVDTEKERLIFEKDEEVRFCFSWLNHSFSQFQRCLQLLHLFPSAAEEDAGGAGEDSGADAEQPEWRLLILPQFPGRRDKTKSIQKHLTL